MSEPREEGAYLTRVAPGKDWPEFVHLTRDAHDGGALSSVVEVWASRPRREADHDVGWVMWLGDGPDAIDGVLLGRYSLDAARAFFRTIPDTSLECVRVPCAAPSESPREPRRRRSSW